MRHVSAPTIPLHRLPSLLLILALAALASGCLATFGPRAIERTHPAYNEAIIASINEQMLQNLVRMRYRDVTFFLEIGSVTTSLSLQASAGVDGRLNFGSQDSLSPGAGIGYADNPTISYTPLQGEDLLKSLLSPLQLEAILVLTQSGWKIDRVFGLCFERINNLYNAPNASGPTPQLEPDYAQFNLLLDALSRLQRRQLIEIGTTQGQDAPGITVRLVADDAAYQADIDRVYELLQLDREVKDFELSTDFLAVTEKQWAVRPPLHLRPAVLSVPDGGGARATSDRRAGDRHRVENPATSSTGQGHPPAAGSKSGPGPSGLPTPISPPTTAATGFILKTPTWNPNRPSCCCASCLTCKPARPHPGGRP